MTSRPRPRQPTTPPLRSSTRGIVLIGFMGSGKSSVGQALSRALGWTFHDLDDRIEATEGCTVAQIFRESGEPAFRNAEREALSTLLKELSSSSPAVIALGGGAFVQPSIRRVLAEAEFPVIWLDAPPEALWERCSKEALQRPLACDLNQFRQLYEERRRHYTQAALHIETSGKEVQTIADELIERLGLNGYAKEK
jgi:shikimate kinase